MKAVLWTGYGGPEVLVLTEVSKPVPRGNQMLIRVHATTVTSGDCEQRSLKLPFWQALPLRAYIGLRKPKRVTLLGMELSGTVEAMGENVTQFKLGDQVFAATGFVNMGTCAEYVCLPEEPEAGAVAIKPVNLSHEQAAAVPVGGLEALSFARKANMQAGQKVLINGAAGTIGPFLVQLVKYFGAEVTAVDHTDKLEMLLSIGADCVVDYTQEDFTKSGKSYDVIFDVVGKSPFSASINSLSKNGVYVIANPSLMKMVRGKWTSLTGDKKVVFGASDPKAEDLVFLKELVESGAVKPVIDRCYPLEQTVEAHRYVESGRKTGNVVLTVSNVGDVK